MGILNNGYRDNYGCLRFAGAGMLGGAAASSLASQFHSPGAQRNRVTASEAMETELAGVPSGCRPPVAWIMPQKSGALAARNTVVGSGTTVADHQNGYNIDAALTGSGGVDNVSTIGLIVSIAAVITASGGVSSATTQALATMVAELTGSGDVAAAAQGLADLGAVLTGSGSVNANNTALMDIAAQIRGYGDMTPEGIRDTVWNALLSQYQDDGTAGKTLSVAGSGGVDYDALWASMPNSLKEALAQYVLAAAQITPIHANIKEVNDTTVDGAGTAGDPWGPV